MLTLYIIDDHPLVAGGIEMMLKDVSHLQICGTARKGEEALSFLAQNKPDIILLDISLPDTDGLKLCEKIRQINTESRIIGLTSANDASIITQLLHKGANGYLLKNMERDELLEAVDRTLSGKIYLSKAANERVLEQFISVQSALQEFPVLTRREKEIIQLLNEGLKGPQIAEKLHLSPYTVETHRKNLMQKMNAGSTQHLLKMARERGLLSG